MSQVGASDRVTCDPQPEPQRSIRGMSPGKETPEVNSKDKFLEKTESQTDIAEISVQKPPTSTREKSDDQEPPTSTREKSEDQDSPMVTTYKSSGQEPPTSTTEKSDDQEPPTSTREKSDDQDPPTSTTEKSDDQEPPTSTTEKSDDQEPPTSTREKSDDQEPPTSTKEKSHDQDPPTSTREKSHDQDPPTSTTEKSEDQDSPMVTTYKSSGQEPPTSITEKSDDQEPPTSNTEKSDDEEPPTSTTEQSDDQDSAMVTTYKSSGQEPPRSIAHNSDEQKSPIGTIDMTSGQVPPANIVASSDEQESPIGTTYNSGKESAKISDKSSGKEMPQVNSKDNSLVEPKSQTGTAENSEQEAPTSRTGKSDEQDSPMVTTYKSSGQEPPTSITHNSDERKSPIGTIDLASGQVPPANTVANSDEQESPIGTTYNSGKESAKISDKSSGKEMPQVNSKDNSLGEPKSQTGTAENSEQEAPTSRTGKSVEQELPKSMGDGSGYQKTQRNTTDYSSESQHITTESITKKHELQLDPPLYPRQRQVFHEGAASQPPPKSETVIGEKPTTRYHWLIGPIVSAVVMVGLYFVLSSKGHPPVHQDPVLQKFFQEFARLKKDFPGQNEGLWFRSEKLLQKHLNMSHPKAPSILLLTAAQDGEQTLHCVSQRLAKSYADSLSANFLMVHGPSQSDFDSDTSKMQIDEKLSSGFQSGSRAAVVYRLETLPPGSLLFLYKYCDHENAAFKKVALVLTILLDEQSLETDLSFTEVEEKVKDFVWERFAYPGVSAHNKMDVDKLGAVWSRISHVVLPVLPVRSMESGGCPGI